MLIGALIAAGVAAALLGLSIFARQGRIVFKPAPVLLLDPSDLSLEFEDVSLRLANGVRIHGWWLQREGSRKLFLLLPGSIGNISHELKTVAFLRDLGANVFIIDYPG